MTTTSVSHQPSEQQRLRDRVSAVLLVLAAAGAFFAFLGAIASTRDAEGERQLIEMWRMYGLLVFSAIFVLLAYRPRGLPGIWEITFFHKAAVAITAVFMRDSDTESADLMAMVDGGLAVVIAVAYVLTRGYTSWRQTT